MNLDEITAEEIVDGFMLPAEMTLLQKREADQQLSVIRKKRMAEQSEQEKFYGKLLQLKLQIENYIKQDVVDQKKDFAYFLKSYIEILPKNKNEIASELDIHRTKLSQLLSGGRKPSEEMFIRLEFHSNQFIPARSWFLLSIKPQEHAIMTDISLRNREKKHVKFQVKLEF